MNHFWLELLAYLSFGDTLVFFENGKAEVKRGYVRPLLLQELIDLSRDSRFSFGGIPNCLHQRFRNVWMAYQPVEKVEGRGQVQVFGQRFA